MSSPGAPPVAVESALISCTNRNAPPDVLLYPVGLLNVIPGVPDTLQMVPVRSCPYAKYAPGGHTLPLESVHPLRSAMLTADEYGVKLIVPPVGPVTLNVTVVVLDGFPLLS